MIIISMNHSFVNCRWFPGTDRKCIRPASLIAFRPSRS